MNFKHKQVLVVGLGRFGGAIGVIRFMVNQGAKVTVTDLKTKDQLSDSLAKLKDLPIKYSLGQHRLEDLQAADIVIVNPAVPPGSDYLKTATKMGKTLETEINLIFKLTKAKIIGVTGTNGKATVCGLIYDMLKLHYGPDKVYLGGNMGISLLEKANRLTDKDWVVLELSSFQLSRLAWIKKSPHISLITNITPDHFEWHGNLSRYAKDKSQIFTFQKASDTSLINLYDPLSRRLFKPWPFTGQAYYVGPKQASRIINNQSLLIQNQKLALPKHRLIGQHNLINMLQASLTAKLCNVGLDEIKTAIANYQPPEHALEYVAHVNKVSFINDSEASNQDAAVKGLESLPKGKIILIAGGYDKGIDLSKFIETITNRVKEVVVIGQTGPKIKSALNQKDYDRVRQAPDLNQAVFKAFKLASPGDFVILSPAASSYDMFDNLEQRGELFKVYVKKLIKTNV